VAVVFAVTLGAVLVGGGLPGPVAAALSLEDVTPGTAFGLFVAGAGAVVLAVWAVSAVLIGRKLGRA
jgi:hypothetical protein